MPARCNRCIIILYARVSSGSLRLFKGLNKIALLRAGIVPKKHILDNEISEALKDIIRDEYRTEMELVPPGCHRRNAAEVSIRNFKAHFLSVMAGTADNFPPSLWDRLLPQAEITVNLLRQSNATPTVSAYAHLTGPFDYNKMPIGAYGLRCRGPQKNRQERQTGVPHGRWVVSSNIERALSHPSLSYQGNTQRAAH